MRAVPFSNQGTSAYQTPRAECSKHTSGGGFTGTVGFTQWDSHYLTCDSNALLYAGTQVRERLDEVLAQVDLTERFNELVGVPGVSGLPTEARKRLTIAVELMANPPVIFMDEPTSGALRRHLVCVRLHVR